MERATGEKGIEEKEKKKGKKDKVTRREVEKISLKGKIYGLKCIICLISVLINFRVLKFVF